MSFSRSCLIVFLMASAFSNADAEKPLPMTEDIKLLSPVSKNVQTNEGFELIDHQDEEFEELSYPPAQSTISSTEQRKALENIQKAYKQETESTFYSVNAFGQRQKAGIVSYQEGLLHVTFQGTKTWADVLTDLDAWSETCEMTGGLVHRGMHKHFQRILRNEEEQSLTKLLGEAVKTISPGTPILFSGHSMGATIALLAAESFRAGALKEKLKAKGSSNPLKVFQVSSPASFDTQSRSHFQQHWPNNSVTMERQYDPVSWWATSNWWGGCAIKESAPAMAPWIYPKTNHVLKPYLESVPVSSIPSIPVLSHLKAFYWLAEDTLQKIEKISPSLNSLFNYLKLI